jgi:hypothetical protein
MLLLRRHRVRDSFVVLVTKKRWWCTAPVLTYSRRLVAGSKLLQRFDHQQRTRLVSSMSLSGLAAVELQLVMHFCDFQSFLSLIRCSRFTIGCALDDFAWRFLLPLTVVLSLGLARRLSSSRILRGRPLSLHLGAPVQPSPFTSSQYDRTRVDDSEWSEMLLLAPLVHQLDCTQREVHCSQIVQLMERVGGDHGLTLLKLPEGQSCIDIDGTLQLMLRHATSLRVLHFDDLQCAAMASTLRAFHALTELHVCGLSTELTEELTRSPPPHLVELSIDCPKETMLERLLLVRSFSTLQTLKLRHVWAATMDSAPIIDWTAVFQNLCSLTRLCLAQLFSVDTVLDALSQPRAAAQLMTVDISSQGSDLNEENPSARHYGSIVPSLQAMEQFLQRHPREMRLTLQLQSREAHVIAAATAVHTSVDTDSDKAAWDRAYATARACEQNHPGRVRCEVIQTSV